MNCFNMIYIDEMEFVWIKYFGVYGVCDWFGINMFIGFVFNMFNKYNWVIIVSDGRNWVWYYYVIYYFCSNFL